MRYLIFIFCLFLLSSADDSIPDSTHFKIAHHINFRDPNDDSNKVDWWIGEISFLKEINRIRASLTPSITFGKRKLLSFGLDCEVNYVDKLIDWKAGYSIGFKLSRRHKDEKD